MILPLITNACKWQSTDKAVENTVGASEFILVLMLFEASLRMTIDLLPRFSVTQRTETL